ncbi:MAG: pseudouridine synthase [Bacteroidota bacterium]
MSTSLNKYISQTGICSRREADKWIEAGRVMINDQPAQKGNRVAAGDVVTIDGEPLQAKPESVYLAFHKPIGVTCTTDQRDPDNIIDYLKYPQRIFPVGRLDKGSSGLILMTNDGDIVNLILREEGQHEKEYVVKVNKPITNTFLKRMEGGLPILGTKTKRCKLERIGTQLFKITLTQGLNRQIRRMCEFLGYKVHSIKRLRVMNIELGRLEAGEIRELTEAELGELRARL